MEDVGVTRALAALVVLAAVLVAPAASAGDGVFLYLYGATWCPYCRNLDQFLSNTYSGSYYFCKIDVSKECQSGLDAIRSFLVKSKGLSSDLLGYIPQTYVIKDGRYLIAIVVGGVTDPQFWKNITARPPQERVLLVVPPNAYEVPMTFEEQRDLIARNLVVASATTQPGQGAAPAVFYILVPGVLIGVGALVIAYAVVKRRR